MPFHIDISFQISETLTSTFEIMSNVTKARLSDIPEIIKNIFPNLPSIQSFQSNPFQKQKSLNQKYNMDLEFLMNIFSTTFIYWSQYNLLGILGTKSILGSSTTSLFPCHLQFDSESPVPQEQTTYERIPLFNAISKSIIPYQRATTPSEKDIELGKINTALFDMLDIDKIATEKHVPDVFTLRTTLMSNQDSKQQIKNTYFSSYQELRTILRQTENHS